jgi:hypothetical protein
MPYLSGINESPRIEQIRSRIKSTNIMEVGDKSSSRYEKNKAYRAKLFKEDGLPIKDD